MHSKRLLPSLLCIPLASSILIANPAFKIGSRNEPIPENGIATYTVVTTGKNEFTLLPPPRWKSEADAKSTSLSWTSPDYRSMIQMRIMASDSDAAPKLKADELRQTIRARHAKVKILEEFPCYTSGLSGLAFDCERPADGGFKLQSRVAFIPISGGTAELTLTAPHEQFTTRQMDFMRLLNSLRVAKLPPN